MLSYVTNGLVSLLNVCNIQQGNQNLSIIRTVVTSPKKKCNPLANSRKTAFCISTPPENVKFIKEPPAQKGFK